MAVSSADTWPPQRADQYFRSDAFGKLMLEVVQLLANRYRHIDFTDAVATAFVWFERAGKADSGFLRSGRFPTIGSFRAYVRQALWNSARAAERNRRTRKEMGPPAEGSELVGEQISPLWLAAFHECRDMLPEPMRSVFDLMQDEDDPPDGTSRDIWAASILGMEAGQIERAYEEACRRIRRCMSAGSSTR